MGNARQPKRQQEEDKRPKQQVTVPWKHRVLARLEENKKAGAGLANIDQLGKHVLAKKGGINKLLDLDRDPPQLTSGYVDEITAALGVLPPVLEEEGDDSDFARHVLLLRDLDPDARQALMVTADAMRRKR